MRSPRRRKLPRAGVSAYPPGEGKGGAAFGGRLAGPGRAVVLRSRLAGSGRAKAPARARALPASLARWWRRRWRQWRRRGGGGGGGLRAAGAGGGWRSEGSERPERKSGRGAAAAAMQEIIASVDHIKFDLEIAVEQQLGAQPLPFPGMDKSGAAVCEFFLKAACGKGLLRGPARLPVGR
uniref:Cleavage and polyadenylation specific factor 4 n=1 Tax=Oryctolagus cuniculus TaxID=9986 RepID=A0A5F9C195_RABIT